MTTIDGFKSYATAGNVVAIIEDIVDSRVNTERPKSRGAKVISINEAERYCIVTYNGETTQVKVPYGDAQPAAVGQIVRIEGLPGDRYIAGVLGDSAAQLASVSAAADAAAALEAADDAIAAAATAQAEADGKVNTYFQPAEPTGMLAEDFGDLWFDTDDGNKAHYWNGSSWLVADDQRIAAVVTAAQNAATAAGDAQATANSKIVTFYQGTEPSNANRTIGDLWINTANDRELKRWSGSAWVSARDTTIAAASTAAASALTAANNAQTAADIAKSIADGAIRTWYQEVAPAGLNNTSDLGDLWYKESTGVASRWNGSAWVAIADSSIGVALAAAQNAQTTADGKIDSFYQSSQPTICSVGDLWFNTGNKNEPYYCSKASPSPTWVVVRDQTIADAQAAAVAAEIAAQNAATAANTAQGTANTAQTTANTKPGTYRQPGTPTGTRIVGDLWIDSDDNDRQRRWDGSTWIVITNPVTDALGELALPELKSPDWVEGIAHGWVIRQDGKAIFNDITTYGKASGPSAGYDELSVSTKLQYKGDTLDDIIDRLPKGRIGYGKINEASLVATNNTKALYRLKVPTTGQTRAIKINTQGLMYKQGGGLAWLKFTIQYNGTGAFVDLYEMIALENVNSGLHYVNMDFYLNTVPPAGYMTIQVSLRSLNGSFSFVPGPSYIGTGNSFALEIIDEGIDNGLTELNNDKTPRTFDITADYGRGYTADGTLATTGPAWPIGVAWDFEGNRKAAFWYSTTATTQFAGISEDDIDTLEVYISCTYAEASRVCRIGHHTGDISNGVFDQFRTTAYMYAGFAAWVPVPKGSAFMTALRNDTFRGIVIGLPGAAGDSYGTSYSIDTPRLRASFRA